MPVIKVGILPKKSIFFSCYPLKGSAKHAKRREIKERWEMSDLNKKKFFGIIINQPKRLKNATFNQNGGKRYFST